MYAAAEFCKQHMSRTFLHDFQNGDGREEKSAEVLRVLKSYGIQPLVPGPSHPQAKSSP